MPQIVSPFRLFFQLLFTSDIFIDITSLLLDVVHDNQLARTLSATVDAVQYRRDTKLNQAANAVFDLVAIEGKEGLIGKVFRNQEEFDQYYPFLMSLVDPSPPEEPETAGEDKLEFLAELLAQSCPRSPSGSDDEDAKESGEPSGDENADEDGSGEDEAGEDDA